MENINTLLFNARGMFVCLLVLVAFWKILSIYSKFYIDFWVQKCTSKIISPPVANLLVTFRWPVGLVLANCRQTVGRLLADCWWRGAVLHNYPFQKNLNKSVSQLSVRCWSTVGQQIADSRLTDYQQSADCRWGELFFTIAPIRMLVASNWHWHTIIYTI